MTIFIYFFNVCSEENIKKAKEIIWCGPTKKAVILPYEYLKSLSKTNYQLEKVNKLLGSSLENYMSTMVIFF